MQYIHKCGMKYLIQLIAALSVAGMASGFAACSEEDGTTHGLVQPSPGTDNDTTDDGNGDDEEMEDSIVNSRINISVGGRTYAATLAGNDAARAFAELMPLTVDMSELNGNEKYYYLDAALPVESCRPGTIRAGDLMLYGSTCLVIFYETFASGYSYTRLGKIDNPEGLAEALGDGDVRVTFSRAESGR